MPARPHRVAVLALPTVLPFELSIPARVFESATGAGGEPLYDVVTCSLDGGPVPTVGDFAVLVRRGPKSTSAGCAPGQTPPLSTSTAMWPPLTYPAIAAAAPNELHNHFTGPVGLL